MTRDELLPHIPARLSPEEQEAWIQSVLDTHPGHKTGDEPPMQPEGDTRDLDGIRRALGELAQRVEVLKPAPAFDATGIERGLKAVQQSVASIPAPAPVNLDGIRQSIGEMHAALDNLGVENRVAHRELLQAVADMKPLGITTEGGLRVVEVPKLIEAPAPVDRWKTPFRIAVLVLLAAIFALSARGQDPATIIRDPAYKPGGAGSPCPVYAVQSSVCSNGQFLPKFVAGAQALYLFNQGSGTTLTDYSGHGYNGTLTGSPTWRNMGLSFASNLQYVTLPAAALNGAGTIQVWFTPQRPDSTNSFIPTLIGTDTFYGLGLGNLLNGVPFAYSAGLSQGSQPIDKVSGLTSFAYIPSTGVTLINGAAPTAYIYQFSKSWTATTNAYISLYNGGNSCICTVYAVAVYSSVLTTTQILQNETAARSLIYASGVYPSSPNYLGNKVAWIGDSISAGGGITYLSQSFTYLSSLQAQQPDFEVIAAGGVQLASISTTYLGYANTRMQPYNGIKVVMMLGGINDLQGGASAATVYSLITTAVTTAHANGLKIVVATVTPSTSCTSSCETNRTTLNSTIISNWISGSLAADWVVDYAGIPVMSSSSFYADGIHPNAVGNAAMAPFATVALRNGFNDGNEPFWVKATVPYTLLSGTAATTKTQNLMQLGPKQKVCGVTQRVTTAFAGTSISAMTASVGNSVGTSTTYTSTLSMLATGFLDAGLPGTAPADGGIVQAAFSATGANLSALTVGSVDFDICVVTQP